MYLGNIIGRFKTSILSFRNEQCVLVVLFIFASVVFQNGHLLAHLNFRTIFPLYSHVFTGTFSGHFTWGLTGKSLENVWSHWLIPCVMISEESLVFSACLKASVVMFRTEAFFPYHLLRGVRHGSFGLSNEICCWAALWEIEFGM